MIGLIFKHRKKVTTYPLHANATGRSAPKYYCKDCQSFCDWGIFFRANSLNKAKKRKNLFLFLVFCMAILFKCVAF
jgi:hypothetical protein